MPLDLLRALAATQLPVTITKLDEIDKARVQHASGFIACTFSTPGSAEPFARVLAITAEGRAALAMKDLIERRKT